MIIIHLIYLERNDEFFGKLNNNNVADKLKELIENNINGEYLEKMYVWWSPWV